MAIQDLINEVNSIQTKKQAIKEAITAKGVTSEGKLSKFADEINKITTKEPDWYIVNKFRYENGNEALLVRTSDKNAINANKYQMVEIGGGVTKDNGINNWFNTSYSDEFGITNGTYFPRETAYRSFATKDSSNVVFDGHNDNLKLKSSNGDKEIAFRDVNVYNWLKGYRNQPLADFNTLYLKSGGFSDNTVKSLSDFLSSANTSTTLTLGTYGATPILLIDSSIMVQAMNLRKMSRVGFISYFDKEVDTTSLIPIPYANNSGYTPFYENKEQYYGNLSPGNYVHLFKDNKVAIVFVSVNYVVDSNGQKHKNIEVYIYNIEIDNSRVYNKPFELYLTFSSRAQYELQKASSPKVFRRQVLAANGTPEPKPMYLNGLDMLGRFASVRGKFLDSLDEINNLFSSERGPDSVEHRSVPYSSGPLRSMVIPPDLGKAIKTKAPIKAFIRLNNDSNNMTFVEFEEIPNDGKFTFSVGYGYYGLAVFQKGINNDNRVVAVFLDNLSQDKCKIYRLKKAGTNQYITNDLFDTTQKNNQLFITANKETIDHINKTPLTTVWTEIQNTLAHKEDYEAYSISNLTYEE